LLGQTLGAATVAILFRAFVEGGSSLALGVAAGIAITAAVISVARLNTSAPA
jgi:hypothetical protein